MKRLRTVGLLVLGVLVFAALPRLAAQSKIELEGEMTRLERGSITMFNGLVSFETGGAKIETDDENFTNLSDLKPGTAIEVDATITPDGVIQATVIEVSDEKEADTEIGGVIATVDEAGQTFTIGPVTVSWDSRTKFKGMSRPRAGLFVEAKLEILGPRLVAKVIEKEDDNN